VKQSLHCLALGGNAPEAPALVGVQSLFMADASADAEIIVDLTVRIAKQLRFLLHEYFERIERA
jgi:hypothetical protein